MFDLYSWTTPNGQKVPIMLEECQLEYALHLVNIMANEQFDPAFLAISPNNKIPALVDQQGANGQPIAIFESGAILMYLAEKTGRFMPTDPAGRYSVIQWLMFQVGGLGPMLGQNLHFRSYAPEKIDYAIARYTKEAERLYRVMNTQLKTHEYLAGDEYSIADMAAFPWISSWQKQGIDLDAFTQVKRWYEAIESRPAVQRAIERLATQVRRAQSAQSVADKPS
jgi:GST-like protein